MKILATFVTLTAVLTTGPIAHAQSLTKTVSEREVVLPVDLSTTKVKLTAVGYSIPVVKILVPELADVTILDHRNTGEEAPCIATYDALEVEDVIKGKPAVEKAKFKISLIKTAQPNVAKGTCEVWMTESITATIRGFPFEHKELISVGQRHIDDCR